MAAKNPAKEALGDWRALPSKLPRKWFKVSPYARFMGLELFRRCDPAYQGLVDVGTPWMDDVCFQMEISGPHRNAAKAALRQLVKAGLVRPLDGRIFIEMGQRGDLADAIRNEPNSNQTQTEVELTPNHVETTSIPNSNQQSSQSVEIVNETFDRIGKEREGEDRKREEGDSAPVAELEETPRQVFVFRHPLAIGYDWLSTTWYAGTGAPDREKWRKDYEKIGSWTAAERAKIAQSMAATPWLLEKRSRATPGHIVTYREQFLEGPRNFGQDRHSSPAKRGPSQVASQAEYEQQAAIAAAGGDSCLPF